MTVSYIIYMISTIAWFLTIFSQKKSSVFLFFLILGLSDPLFLLFNYIVKVPNGVVYSFAAISFYMVFRFNDFKSIKLKLIDYSVFIAFFYVVFTLSYIYYFVLGVHIYILFKFIKRIITALHFQGELLIFFLVLVFYEISLLFKGIIFIAGTGQGFYLFFITLAFQILIAIFFIIFREDNPKLIIKMTEGNL